MINKSQPLVSIIMPCYNSEMFISFYNEDKMGGMIRNLDVWLKEYVQVINIIICLKSC